MASAARFWYPPTAHRIAHRRLQEHTRPGGAIQFASHGRMVAQRRLLSDHDHLRTPTLDPRCVEGTACVSFQSGLPQRRGNPGVRVAWNRLANAAARLAMLSWLGPVSLGATSAVQECRYCSGGNDVPSEMISGLPIAAKQEERVGAGRDGRTSARGARGRLRLSAQCGYILPPYARACCSMSVTNGAILT